MDFTKETRLIKTMLNLKEDKNEIITACLEMQYNAVLGYINEEDLPNELRYVVVETAIARYNRRGYEGIERSERDILRDTFTDDLLKPYRTHLNRFNQPIARFK